MFITFGYLILYGVLLYLSCLLSVVVVGFFCFFFKQKTAYEMRISDWSSDVCSSDLPYQGHGRRHELGYCSGRDRGSDPRLRRRAVRAARLVRARGARGLYSDSRP